jgi:hypothetical protein
VAGHLYHALVLRTVLAVPAICLVVLVPYHALVLVADVLPNCVVRPATTAESALQTTWVWAPICVGSHLAAVYHDVYRIGSTSVYQMIWQQATEQVGVLCTPCEAQLSRPRSQLLY